MPRKLNLSATRNKILDLLAPLLSGIILSQQLLADTRIFIDDMRRNGAYGDREAADSICIDSAQNPAIAGNQVKALLSFSEIDEIRDFPVNHNLDTSEAIYRVDGITQVANNWAQLLCASCTLTNTLTEPSESKRFWTFSKTEEGNEGAWAGNDGEASGHCVSGTSSAFADKGQLAWTNRPVFLEASRPLRCSRPIFSTACISFSSAAPVPAAISVTGWH